MSEAQLWRSESAQRLRDAMADGSHSACALFGNWYRARVFRSIATRYRPFAAGSLAEVAAQLATLERRWHVRHAALCEAAGLEDSLRNALAASVLRRVFDATRQNLGLEQPSASDDLGVLG